jgi:hypothetical protein
LEKSGLRSTLSFQHVKMFGSSHAVHIQSRPPSTGVLFGIWSARPAPAQVFQTAYDFQTIQPHPYVHALGNATAAARGYPGAIGVNPATIGTEGAVRIGSNVNLSDAPLYSSPGISTSFADYWIAAPSATVKMGSWAGAAQVKHFSRGSLEIRKPAGRASLHRERL